MDNTTTTEACGFASLQVNPTLMSEYGDIAACITPVGQYSDMSIMNATMNIAVENGGDTFPLCLEVLEQIQTVSGFTPVDYTCEQMVENGVMNLQIHNGEVQFVSTDGLTEGIPLQQFLDIVISAKDALDTGELIEYTKSIAPQIASLIVIGALFVGLIQYDRKYPGALRLLKTQLRELLKRRE